MISNQENPQIVQENMPNKCYELDKILQYQDNVINTEK